MDQLIEKLSCQYTSANSEEGDLIDDGSLNPYASLEEEMKREIGWDYSCHSSDSENYYGSHRSSISNSSRDRFFRETQSENSDQETDAVSRSRSDGDFTFLSLNFS